MDIAHHKPAPAPTTLTGYQHEILRRIDERGTVRSITRNLPGPIVDGVWTEVDRLWSWGLILLRGKLDLRMEPVYVLTDAGRAMLKAVP